jgi:serine O-acetyltransferase
MDKTSDSGLEEPLQFEPSRREFEAFLELQLALVGLRIGDLSKELAAVYPLIARQFVRIRNKYFRNAHGPVLRVAHNTQYTIFLYHLSRAAFALSRRGEADRIYSLLRIVSCVDLYYEIKLPEIWCCDHPLGTVIGRGDFSPDATLVFSQNCTIGNNRDIYPQIHGNLHMLPNSTMLGRTKVVGNVMLANGSCVIDAGELANCFVFGRSPDLILKPMMESEFRQLSPLVY